MQVEGLLAVPPTFVVVGEQVVRVQQTRLGLALSPPDFGGGSGSLNRTAPTSQED